MIRLMAKRPFYGLQYRGTTYDCGDKVGFLAANVALALGRPDVGPGFRAALKKILADTGGL
jgi:UTP--glucose-1-phosphate uridylyltransferase